LVLGTLITEGNDGVLFWNNMMKSNERCEWFAAVLALIQEVHQFDGYLLNIENVLQFDQVPKMLRFVQYLKKVLPVGSSLIWYVKKPAKVVS